MSPELGRKIGFYALVTVIVVYALFPFYYAILSSLKSSGQLFDVDYFPFTFDVTSRNYDAVFTQSNFAKSIWNSIVVACGVVFLASLLGLTGAYALARVKFRGRGLILMTILGVSMFPQVAVLAGMFEVIRYFGLQNSLWSLIFSYMIFTLPFTVWVLTTFMRGLPVELEEAAIMDGANPWQIITRVFMPLMWPAVVTTGLLAFIAAWNEFLFALTFIVVDDQRTVPVAIGTMGGASAQELPWGNIMAASVVVTVPVVVLVLIFQKRIISGLTDGAIKG